MDRQALRPTPGASAFGWSAVVVASEVRWEEQRGRDPGARSG
ncbi:MAG: hypothetical protein U0V56_13005 [Actinomycetota bacterium]